MSKSKLEFRVVCNYFGTHVRHSSHKWNKMNKKKASQSVIDLNHTADVRPHTSFYQGEAPYRVQVREVSGWKDELDYPDEPTIRTGYDEVSE